MNVDSERLAKGLYWQRAWKLIEGCTKVSPGCDNCWSESETVMRSNHPNGKIKDRALIVTAKADQDGAPVSQGCFTGQITMREDNLNLPLTIKKPTVFAIWNDLFHEGVDVAFILSAYDVMAKCPQHTFLILTKRAERLHEFIEFMNNAGNDPFPENVYHGVTICNQAEADRNIPLLLQVPGNRFLSIEPLLGPIDFGAVWVSDYFCPKCENGFDTPKEYVSPCCGHKTNGDDEYICGECNESFAEDEEVSVCPHCDNHGGGLYIQADHRGVFRNDELASATLNGINQVLLGGESGKNARPMHPDWVRSVRDQCEAAGVPFMFKQWGEWLPGQDAAEKFGPNVCDKFECHYYEPHGRVYGSSEPNRDMYRVGKKKAGRTLDGKLHDELIWKQETEEGKA